MPEVGEVRMNKIFLIHLQEDVKKYLYNQDTGLSGFGNLDEGQELGHLQKRFFLSAAAIFV